MLPLCVVLFCASLSAATSQPTDAPEDAAAAYRHKIWSFRSLSRPDSYVKSKGEEIVFSNEFEFKAPRQEASWKMMDGLSSVEGVSFQSTSYPGNYLAATLPSVSQLNGEPPASMYEVFLWKKGSTEPKMSQMTFVMQPPLAEDTAENAQNNGTVSFKLVKSEAFTRDDWWLREMRGRLFVQQNDDSFAFQTAATFEIEQPKYDTCFKLQGQPMCSDQGTCENIKNGKGVCKCKIGFKGNACQLKTVDAVDPIASSDKFDYKSPQSWATLDPKWKICGEGKRQSPILFDNEPMIPLHLNQFLSLQYKASPYKVVRKGKSIQLQVKYPQGQYVNAGGFKYDLSHVELHAPGEHTFTPQINSQCKDKPCPYDMEFHVIHTLDEIGTVRRLGEGDLDQAPTLAEITSKNATQDPTPTKLQPRQAQEAEAKDLDGSQAVKDVGMLILAIPAKLGTSKNGVVEDVIESMPEQDSEKEAPGVLNLLDIMPANPTYYRYLGSMTRPPCTEDVVWYVFSDPVEVAAEQVQAIYAANGKNARPVQSLNDRKVAATLSREEDLGEVQIEEVSLDSA